MVPVPTTTSFPDAATRPGGRRRIGGGGAQHLEARSVEGGVRAGFGRDPGDLVQEGLGIPGQVEGTVVEGQLGGEGRLALLRVATAEPSAMPSTTPASSGAPISARSSSTVAEVAPAGTS